MRPEHGALPVQKNFVGVLVSGAAFTKSSGTNVIGKRMLLERVGTMLASRNWGTTVTIRQPARSNDAPILWIGAYSSWQDSQPLAVNRIIVKRAGGCNCTRRAWLS